MPIWPFGNLVFVGHVLSISASLPWFYTILGFIYNSVSSLFFQIQKKWVVRSIVEPNTILNISCSKHLSLYLLSLVNVPSHIHILLLKMVLETRILVPLVICFYCNISPHIYYCCSQILQFIHPFKIIFSYSDIMAYWISFGLTWFR